MWNAIHMLTHSWKASWYHKIGLANMGTSKFKPGITWDNRTCNRQGNKRTWYSLSYWLDNGRGARDLDAKLLGQ